MMVERNIPASPWWLIAVATTTVNAAAGPPIWKRLPPSSDTRNPPTIAVNSPRSGDAPEAMAIAMESGSATMATVRPASASAHRSRKP